jgi:hypothetical protein
MSAVPSSAAVFSDNWLARNLPQIAMVIAIPLTD